MPWLLGEEKQHRKKAAGERERESGEDEARAETKRPDNVASCRSG